MRMIHKASLTDTFSV